MRFNLRTMRQELPPTLRLALPLIVAEVGWMAMQIVDTMMVGRLPESAVAIGAVSLGSVLFFAVGIFGGGLLLGMDTLVSQSFGAGELEDCHHSLVNSLYMALVLTPLLMGVVWLWVPFLRAFRIQPEVLETAIPYLRALNWSMLPLLLYFSLRRYLQGIHIVKPVAWALITANLVNVVANWALVYGHLGVPMMRTEGAGWATCISRSYLSVFLVITILYANRRGQLGLARTQLRPDFARIRELVRLGLPAATQLALEVTVFAVVTALIGRLDAVSLAAHQVTLNTISLTYMVPLGISSAAAVRVGHALGRRDPEGAARAGWAAIGLGAGFMAAAAVVLWTAPGPIVRIYTPDHQVLVTGTLLLFIAAFFQLFDGVQAVVTGALRGAGDTRTPMITHVLSYWLMGLPLGAWLCFRRGWGAAGLWLGLSLALIVIGSVLLLAWRRQVRAFGRLIAPERHADPVQA